MIFQVKFQLNPQSILVQSPKTLFLTVLGEF